MSCKKCEENRKKFAEQIAKAKAKEKEIQIPLNEKTDKPVCIVVTGMESSGTRLATKMLISMGCEGDSEHIQIWDRESPDPERNKLIVLRRSIPHGGKYNLATTIYNMQNIGYQIIVINVIRDWFPMIMSSIKNKHVNFAKDKLAQMPKYLLELYKLDVPIYPITYLGIGAGQLNILGKLLNVGLTDSKVEFKNADANYKL